MNALETILLVLGLVIGIVLLVILAYYMGKYKSLVPIVFGVVGIIFFGFSIYCMVDLNYYYTAEGGVYGVISSLFHTNTVEGEDLEFSLKNIELKQVDGDQYAASIRVDRIITFEEDMQYIVKVNGIPTTTSDVTKTYAQATYNYTFYNEDWTIKNEDVLNFSFAFYPNFTTLKVTTNGGSEAIKLWNSYFQKNNFVVTIEESTFDTSINITEGDISNFAMVTYYFDNVKYASEAYTTGSALSLLGQPTVASDKEFLGWLNDEDEEIEDGEVLTGNMNLYGYTCEPILDFDIQNGNVVSYSGDSSHITIPSTYSEFKGRTVKGEEKTVTSIGFSLFYENTEIKTIILPETVTLINGQAFKGCSNLTSIVIPKNVLTIGNNAFKDCQNLETVAIASYDIYTQLISNEACGGLLSAAQNILVLTSVDDGSNEYLNNETYYTKTVVEDSENTYCLYTRAEATTEDSYTVEFYNHDGSLYDTKSISNGNLIVFPENPTRERETVINKDTGKTMTVVFTFSHWEDEYGNTITVEKIITSNLKLTAVFDSKIYNDSIIV